MNETHREAAAARCRDHPPKKHRLILTADCRQPLPATPRSWRLGFCLDAEYDAEHHTYELCPGDSLGVEIYVLHHEDEASEDYEIHMMNLVSWRGFRRRDQVFSGLLRGGGDSPDERILADGIPRFERCDEPHDLDPAALAEQGSLCLEPAPPYAIFKMREPGRLILDRPGLFAFLVSVTVQRRFVPQTASDPEPIFQYLNFIIDPELDVGGTYPPD